MSQKPKRWDELPEWVRKAALRWHRGVTGEFGSAGESLSKDERAELAGYLDYHSLSVVIDEICERTLVPYELEMRSQQAREAEERRARAEDWVRIGEAIARFVAERPDAPQRCGDQHVGLGGQKHVCSLPPGHKGWHVNREQGVSWSPITGAPALPAPTPSTPAVEWMTESEWDEAAVRTGYAPGVYPRRVIDWGPWTGRHIRVVPDDTQWGVWCDRPGDDSGWLLLDEEPFILSRVAANKAIKDMCHDGWHYSVRPYPMGAER